LNFGCLALLRADQVGVAIAQGDNRQVIRTGPAFLRSQLNQGLLPEPQTGSTND
jgi:hypothetical protein